MIGGEIGFGAAGCVRARGRSALPPFEFAPNLNNALKIIL